MPLLSSSSSFHSGDSYSSFSFLCVGITSALSKSIQYVIRIIETHSTSAAYSVPSFFFPFHSLDWFAVAATCDYSIISCSPFDFTRPTSIIRTVCEIHLDTMQQQKESDRFVCVCVCVRNMNTYGTNPIP